jgi:hypothetical protein
MRPARERGSATPIVVFSTVVVAVLGIGGATIGRVVAGRSDAQRAADASALAAADLVRLEGMQAGREDALALGQLNSRQADVSFAPEVTETPDSVLVAMRSELDVSAPRFVNAGGAVPVGARAVAKIGQFIQADVDWKYPKLVLVLDYSGSMASSLAGAGGQEAIDVLEDSVRRILDEGLKIDFAATFFESVLAGFVPFPPQGSLEQIRHQLDSLGPMGGTCTECGLNKAYDLLDGEDAAGYFVLLVSDGAPNDAGAARQAAHRLWDDLHATIFTLHIDYSGGGSGGLSDFMKSVSGPPGGRPDKHKGHYFPVSDAASLESALRGILSLINCYAGPVPLDQPIDDPSTVRVFLRDSSGHETKLPPIDDLAEGMDELGFMYDPESRTAYMTYSTCESLSAAGDKVILRFNRARLIE